MPTRPKVSRTRRLASLAQAKAGLVKHFAGQTLVLDNKVITAEQLAARFDTLATGYARADAAKAAWLQQLQQASASIRELTLVVTALERYTKGRLGPRSPQLTDFGFAPERAPYKPVKTRLAAVTKSKATRVARNTMGKRQKRKIRGKLAK